MTASSIPLASSSPMRASARAHVLDVAEQDRSGGACRRAGRLEPDLLAVVTERALERASIVGPAVDDAERATDHTVATAVADVRLDVHRLELGPHDRAGRTRLEAACMGAVLAHVGRKRPRDLLA